MKKFLSLTMTAIILTVVVALSLLAFNTAAAETNVSASSKNVIFVMDSAEKIGDGSGRDAENPFWPDPNKYYINKGAKKDKEDVPVYDENGPVYSSEENHKKTALYQAAAALADTGGTIVICGPVEIGADESYGSGSANKDFFFPNSDKKLTITSVYGEVDYSKAHAGKTYGNAKFTIAAPAHISFNSPAVMEYITINTNNRIPSWSYDTNYYRLICANGNDLVMGNGIKCTSNQGTSNGRNLVCVFGGSRYGNLNSDTNLTIKSGEYNKIGGSISGLDGKYVQTGDVHLTIAGSLTDPVKIRVGICGTSNYSANVMLDGDIYMDLSGVRFGGNLALVGPGQFVGEGHKINVKMRDILSYNVSVIDEYTAALYRYDEKNDKHLNYYTTYEVDKKDENGNVVKDENGNVVKETKYVSADINANFKEHADVTAVKTSASYKLLDLEDAKVTSMDSSKYTADQLLSRWSKGLSNTNVIYPKTWATVVSGTMDIPTVVPQNNTDVVIAKAFEVTGIDAHTNDPISWTTNDIDVVCDTTSIGEKDFAYKYGNVTIASGQTTVAAAPMVTLEGVRIKTGSTTQGMRFVANYDNEGATIVDKGVIVVKSHAVSDPENITLDTVFGMAGGKVVSEYEKKGKNCFESEYDYPILLGEYNTNYTARAYVKYEIDGKTYTRYSNVIERNLYEVARAAVNGSSETDTTKSYLGINVVNKINTLDNTKLQTTQPELDAMRDKVTGYMDLQANIVWTPSQTFFMYNKTNDSDIKPYRYVYESGVIVEGVGMAGALFEKGKTYKGLPYISSSDPDMENANLESFGSYISVDKNTGLPTIQIDQIVKYEEDGTVKKVNGYEKKIYSINKSYTSGTTMNEYVNGTAKFLYLDKLSPIQKGQAYINYTIFPGSHCTQAVFSAWNTIINNRKATSDVDATYAMVPGKQNAILPVGGYKYIYSDYRAYTGEYSDYYNGTKDSAGKTNETNGNGRYLNDDGTTAHIRESDSLYIAKYLNSKDVMYEAYEALQPGDGMIQYLYNYSTSLHTDSNKTAAKWTGSGHARLVLSVDKENDTVTTLECANWTVPYVVFGDAGFGTETVTDNNSCWRERTYTFDKLIDTGYIPVTLPELRTGIQEQNNVVLTDAKFAAGTLEGTITSSKQIVSVTAKIVENGKEIYNDITYVVDDARHLRTYDISKLGLGEKFVAGKTYTVTITVGTPGEVVYTGGNPTGYTPTQTTIVDYTFTA